MRGGLGRARWAGEEERNGASPAIVREEMRKSKEGGLNGASPAMVREENTFGALVRCPFRSSRQLSLFGSAMPFQRHAKETVSSFTAALLPNLLMSAKRLLVLSSFLDSRSARN